MAKSQDNPLVQEADEQVTAIEKELVQIESLLAKTMKDQQPGFSQQMLELLESSRSIGLKLAAAVSSQAERKSAFEEFERLAAVYTKERQRQDTMAFLTNRALVLVSNVLLTEETLREKSANIHSQLSEHVREVGREDHALYEVLSNQRTSLDETIEADVKAPAARAEMWGFPVISETLKSKLLDLAHTFRRAAKAEK